MYPLLIKIGPVPIHTYGFLIAIGFLVALWFVKRLAIQSQLNPEKLVDMSFWALLSGFVGARILFVITRADYFLQNPVAIFRVWEGGLVFYGGVILAFFVAVTFMRRNQLPVWASGDIAVVGLTLAHAFGRLGCMAAGCCYGRPTGSDWGVRLQSELVDLHYRGIPLHPTQLYSSVSLFLLFGGLLYVFKKKAFDGQVMLTYFIAYPIIRSVIEVYRGDLIRGFVIDDVLSTSQFISILVFAVAATILVIRLRQIRQNQVEASS